MRLGQTALAAFLAGTLALTGMSACAQQRAPETQQTKSGITLSINRSERLLIDLNSTDGYNLVQQGVNFIITKDNRTEARAVLQNDTDFAQYLADAQKDDSYQEETINNLHVVLTHEDDVYEALVSIDDSQTHIRIVDRYGSDSIYAILNALHVEKSS